MGLQVLRSSATAAAPLYPLTKSRSAATVAPPVRASAESVHFGLFVAARIARQSVYARLAPDSADVGDYIFYVAIRQFGARGATVPETVGRRETLVHLSKQNSPAISSRPCLKYGSSPLRSRHSRTKDPTPASVAAARFSPGSELPTSPCQTSIREGRNCPIPTLRLRERLHSARRESTAADRPGGCADGRRSRGRSACRRAPPPSESPYRA